MNNVTAQGSSADNFDVLKILISAWPRQADSGNSTTSLYPDLQKKRSFTLGKKINSWEGKWERLDKQPFGKGGQGSAFKVRRKDKADTVEYVLKTLNVNDQKRRARMRREIAALRGLNIRGVPRIVDGNEDADELVPLFIVMEYVPGATLEQKIKESPLHIDAALDLVEAILTTVDKCHQQSVLHRDIKPDNIVLRNGEPSDPVLIDFGLSIDTESEYTKTITTPEHELGNRFLRLPELQTSGANSRNVRSDVTYCCAILFFAITGIIPRILVDESLNMPHRRKNVDFSNIDDKRRAALFAIFDRGFDNNIELRWPSAAELLRHVRTIRKGVPLLVAEQSLRPHPFVRLCVTHSGLDIARLQNEILNILNGREINWGDIATKAHLQDPSVGGGSLVAPSWACQGSDFWASVDANENNVGVTVFLGLNESNPTKKRLSQKAPELVHRIINGYLRWPWRSIQWEAELDAQGDNNGMVLRVPRWCTTNFKIFAILSLFCGVLVAGILLVAMRTELALVLVISIVVIYAIVQRSGRPSWLNRAWEDGA